jgi:DNA-binding LacI/PurR family transcriptional regulator
MPKSPTTIRDIARMLGISKSTVSRALNDHYDVNPETARKVRELAAKIDFQPNMLAQHFKQQKTFTIGVIIPETVNRFFAKAIGGIQQVADREGYNVIICQSNESMETEKKNLNTLLSNRVDGLLISVSRETNKYDHFQQVINQEVPLVFFDRIVEELSAYQIHSDNYEISMQGTEHLIDQGCKRIAFSAGPSYLYNSRNRLKGYLDALQKRNLPIDENIIIHTNYKLDNVEDYTRHLFNMQNKPDAVFALNDLAAIETMHILKKRGISIPNDVAILGFNNETICRFVEPSLSSIDHPAFDMGKAATEMLLLKIKQDNLPQNREIVKSRLVIRESTLRKF